MKIECIAFVGPDNNPLYIKHFPGSKEDTIKYHLIVHASLDYIDEALSSKPRTDQNLGFLYPTEHSRVYGYYTNTRNKIILVIADDHQRVPENSEISLFFKQVHYILVDALCNPFHVMGDPIKGSKFESKLLHLVKSKSPESEMI